MFENIKTQTPYCPFICTNIINTLKPEYEDEDQTQIVIIMSSRGFQLYVYYNLNRRLNIASALKKLSI